RRGDGAGEPCGAYEVRAPRGPGDAGDDAEDRSKAVVGAVDGPRDPAGSPLVPALPGEDLVEALLGGARTVTGAQRDLPGEGRDRPGVGPLVLADRGEQRVGVGVAGGQPVAGFDLVFLG